MVTARSGMCWQVQSKAACIPRLSTIAHRAVDNFCVAVLLHGLQQAGRVRHGGSQVRVVWVHKNRLLVEETTWICTVQ